MTSGVNKQDLKPGMKLRHLISGNIATVVPDKKQPDRLAKAHRNYVQVTRRQQSSGRKWKGTWSLRLVEIA